MSTRVHTATITTWDTAPSLTLARMMEQANAKTARLHSVAKCRWCSGRFARIYDEQWVCQTEACAAQQVGAAMWKTREPASDESPFLLLPLPRQVDIQRSTLSNLLVAGAAGTGKSKYGRWHFYRLMQMIPGFQCLLLRCTYDQLLKNHLKFIPAEADLLGWKWTGLNGASARQLHARDAEGNANGSILWAGYCDDEADIAQHVGPEWDGILLEEGVTFLPRAINEISARARGSETARAAMEKAGLKGQSLILSNPGGRAMLYLSDHYITRTPDREEYPNYQPDRHGYLGMTLDDNPYLDEDYEQNNLSHLSRARYRQLRHGDWTVFAGQFFGAFDPDLHIVMEEAA